MTRAAILALGLACASLAPAQLSVSGSRPVTVLDTAPAAQSITAINGTAAITLAGQSSVGLAISGTWTATLIPELSFDGGTTWVATFFLLPNTGQYAASVAANGSYAVVTAGGASNARIRASAFTSGTVSTLLRAAELDGFSGLMAGSDGTVIRSLLTDGSGRLVPAASTGTVITAAATTAVKGTAGVLRRVVIGTGVASATVRLFNVAGASCTGTPGSGALGVITVPATLTTPLSMEFHQAFSAGICVVTSGATNVTVIFD